MILFIIHCDAGNNANNYKKNFQIFDQLYIYRVKTTLQHTFCISFQAVAEEEDGLGVPTLLPRSGAKTTKNAQSIISCAKLILIQCVI